MRYTGKKSGRWENVEHFPSGSRNVWLTGFSNVNFSNGRPPLLVIHLGTVGQFWYSSGFMKLPDLQVVAAASGTLDHRDHKSENLKT